ncbi:Vault protein inter-alpha-trypsin domain protein [Pelomyxa schiedti]|nr:Vault protein inter-alpha-trypsin domain protein [Pelomyxa schiedti]
MMDINGIWKHIEAAGIGAFITHSVYSAIISNNLPVDLRVVLSWDVDMTDVDLIVEDPHGERCYPFQNHTRHGGLLSEDFTRGYGPVEYLIKEALPGPYKIFASLFHAPSTTSQVFCAARIYTNFGRPDAQSLRVVPKILTVPKKLELLAQVFVAP